MISLTGNLQSKSYSTTTNTTVTEPTSAAENDIFIAALHIESDTAVTKPSGWDLLYTVNFTINPTYNLYVYGIRRGASAPDLTWTHASASTEAVVKRYSGCVESGSYEDCTGSTNRNNTSPVTGTSITTNTNNAALVLIIGDAITRDFAGWSSPLTERYDGDGLGVADGLQAASGASGDKTITGDLGTEWVTVLLALKPAPTTCALTGTATASITEADIV